MAVIVPDDIRYKHTHPWISFSLPVFHPSQDLWLLLGEAKSKCEHLANVVMEPSLRRQLHQLYLAKGALATNAIEGNTLSEAEVLKQVTEGEIALPPSQEYLAQETENIINACNLILADIKKGVPPKLTLETIEY